MNRDYDEREDKNFNAYKMFFIGFMAGGFCTVLIMYLLINL